MKKIKYILIITVLLGLFSCEDFLEEEYLSGNSTESQYTTPDGMETLINASYAFLKFFYGREEGFDFSEIGTDIFDYGQQHDYKFQFRYEASFDATHTRNVILWVTFYKGVNACNDAIDVLRNPERTPFNEEKTKIRLSEVRYIRALYNWLIVETWGGVELRDEPVKGVIKTAQKHSVEDFYTLILDDLDYAVNTLKELKAAGTDANTNATDYGRVNLYAAQALRARIRLTWASQTDNDDLAAQAAADADEVIQSNKFALYDDYNDVWDIGNNGSVNDENIWAINYSYTQYAQTGYNQNELRSYQTTGVSKEWTERDGGHHGHLMYGSQYDVQPGMTRDLENGRPFRRYSPTKYLIDAFHEDVDERFDGSFKSVWFCNVDSVVIAAAGHTLYRGDTCIYYTKGDFDDAKQNGGVQANYFWHTDRHFWCMDYDNMFNADGTTNDAQCFERNIFFELKKFMDPNRAAANGAGSERGGRDAMVIRYSEMFLIKSEGNMRAGNATEAYNALLPLANARSKDGDGAALLANYGIDDGSNLTFDFYLDERAREFCGEQLRWFDMKRFGADNMVQRMKTYAGNAEARTNFDAHFVIRPIPQVQIDALQDKTSFPQNEGY